MSLRARVARLAFRHLFKSSGDAKPVLTKLRRSAQRLAWWVPRPPRTTTSTNVDAGGVPAVRVTTPRSRADHHVLYLHGGGYIYGTPALYRDLTWRIADAASARVLVADYRLAPEHPFPAGLDDAVGAYRWLLSEGADPHRTAIVGDSAGGGLTLAALLRLRDERVPLPAAAVALSPWADLTLTSESILRFAATDPMLDVSEARQYAAWYLGDADPRHPHASPVFGDATGLPPCLIQASDDEMLRDDAVTMAERLRAAGCVAELELWPGMPHVWHMLARVVPEARQAIDGIGLFLQKNWAQSRS